MPRQAEQQDQASQRDPDLAAAHAGRRRWQRPLRYAETHPVAVVAATSLTIRLAAALALGLRPGYAVPDEQQYVELAHYVAIGRGAEAWFPNYGQSLYDSTYSFSMPLAVLERVFGQHQILGQLISVVFGTLTAALVTLLALRLLPRRWALGAGLAAALLPSQVYWSSVSIRESMVWATLAATAVAIAGAAATRSLVRLAGAGVLAFVALLMLGHLRQQTLFAAVCALALSVFTFRVARPVLVRTAAVALAIWVPMLSGIGPGGYALLEQAIPKLGLIRHNLAGGAASAFVHDPVLAVPQSPSSSAKPSSSAGPAAAGGPGGTSLPGGSARPGSGVAGPATSSLPPKAPDGLTYITAPGGRTYVVDDTPQSNLRALPRGLVAVAARPFPWERSSSPAAGFAKAETPVWITLYVLALLGIWRLRRSRSVIAFPVLVSGAIIAAAAVSQGNLGTSFRHRGQILWALAPLAAVGLHSLVTRRRAEPDAGLDAIP